METPQSKWFTGSIVVIIVVAVIIVLAGYPFKSRNALKFVVVGVNTDPVDGPVAMLAATNESADDIHFLVVRLQVKSHGAWSYLPYPMTNIALTAHSARNFTITMPHTNGTWRVPAWWRYKNTGPFVDFRGNIEANFYINWQNLMQGQAPHYYTTMQGSWYMALSPELTN